MYHQITLVGNLGGDPVMRYTPNGNAVTSFSMATNRKYKGPDGEQKDETIWWRVSAWGKQAELINQYLTKGAKVLITGSMTPDETGNPRVWKKDDGSYHASFEVRANEVRFLDGKKDSAGAKETVTAAADDGAF